VKPKYQYLDAALLRAAAHSGDVRTPPLPETGTPTEQAEWSAWLAAVWARPGVADAVAVASPVLAGRVEAVSAGRQSSVVQLRRMGLALARYLVRMRGRATPFGLFAGVAAVRFGERPSVLWTDVHRTRIRADATWLAEVIGRLERHPGLLRRLVVTTNNLAVVRGDRLVVPSWVAADGGAAAAEVSLRHVPVVQMIIEAARSPIEVDRLLDALTGVPPSVGEGVVSALVACGALVTNLCAPATSVDTLGHLLGQLELVGGSSLADVRSLVERLSVVRAQFDVLDTQPVSSAGAVRSVVAARMRTLSGVAEQPLMVDLRMGCAVTLPGQVGREVASAAETLVRLTPHPGGLPGWREYHARFLDRYGTGAVVPVGELVDPAIGLGFPRHYAESHAPGSSVSPRDERVLMLAQQAVMDGAQEIVLASDLVDELAVGDVMSAPPHLDLCVDVRAVSMVALAAGAFTVAVRGAGATALATSGRLVDVLDVADQRLGEYRRLPVAVNGAALAQLSFPAPDPHLRNVHRTPPVLAEVISLGEHRDAAPGLGVRDLAVTADQRRMYVVSLSRRQVVEPIVTHAAGRHTMPALARLLFEIPRTTTAAISLFDWGPARCLPFRPRVRRGRCILSAARWRVSRDQLPGRTASRAAWVAAVAALRDRLRWPATVYVGTRDRRLWLNLDDTADLAVLRDHVTTTEGPITVMEAPSTADYGWLDGRAHEVVLPLVSTAPPAPTPTIVTSAAPLPVVGRMDAQLPGSAVLFAKVYGHPDVFDTILTRHLPDLLDGWDERPPWWFVRYRTRSPHLRLRLRVRDYGQAAARLGVWAARLRRDGLAGDLTLDTYHPEIGRYGPGPAMTAAENLFAADSAAVIAQLAARSRDVPPHVLTAVSLLDLAAALLGSRTHAARWFIDHPELATVTPASDRAAFRHAARLASEVNAATAPGGPAVAAQWKRRYQAAAHYRACLTTTHLTPETVLASLSHLHCVRAHGIDAEAEALAHRLARSVALSWHARTSTTEPPS
jgi:thiopeptide-type bacteriocin biosynthesis protein